MQMYSGQAKCEKFLRGYHLHLLYIDSMEEEKEIHLFVWKKNLL